MRLVDTEDDRRVDTFLYLAIVGIENRPPHGGVGVDTQVLELQRPAPHVGFLRLPE